MKTSSKNYTEEILCAGFGGQGIMFMGKLIAQAGLLVDKHVTWMPSYGAEVRGGTAYSMTKISQTEIADPLVLSPTILVAMNRPSLIKYGEKVRPGGVLIANTSFIDEIPKRKDVTIIKIPMTEKALKLGDAKCANMFAVGAITKVSKLISLRTVLKALEEVFKHNDTLYALNRKAVEEGYKV